MAMTDMARLGWLGARGGWRLGVDALGDRSGRSLPYRVDEVTGPATLTRLINAGAVPPGLAPVAITAVALQDIPSVSSNCHNLVLSIEQADTPRLPESLFVKLPMAALGTRWFFTIINAWRLESHFFRHVAPTLPIRTPLTFATEHRGSRFYLVQENLNADPSVTLFTNPDMQAGPPLDLVYRCLDTFARLHACHAGLDATGREALLPRDFHLFLSADMGLAARLLNRLALAPCRRKQPGVIPDDVARAYRATMDNWERLLAYWFSEPLSLLHGDSHLGNFFVSGDDMGMLDWQAAHWGKGIRDVQYFLTDSLPAPTLAAHESELVAYYVARRALHGAPVDPELTWEQYRSFSFHTLMTIVVSIGYGALNAEQDALMAEVLRRAVAAVERLDYPGWLAQFLGVDRL